MMVSFIRGGILLWAKFAIMTTMTTFSLNNNILLFVNANDENNKNNTNATSDLNMTLSKESETLNRNEPYCYGYMYTNMSHTMFTTPKSIPCERSINNTYGNEWSPNIHQLSSCCTGNGRYHTQISNIGGFDVMFNWRDLGGTIENIDSTCQAYTSSLQALLCDPMQGNYIEESAVTNATNTTITNNETLLESQEERQLPLLRPYVAPVLRICKSSCDAVFDACGLPGKQYSSKATYTDGTSLCYEAWGGFDNKDGDPCKTHPLSMPCQLNLSIKVIDDTIPVNNLNFSNDTTILDDFYHCLHISYPTAKELESYKKNRKPPVPDECIVDDDPNILAYAIGIGIGVLIFFTCGLCLAVYCKRQQMIRNDIGDM